MQQDSQAYLYRSKDEIIPVTPKNKISFTLKELQDFVTGHIEILNLKDGRLMILNEEGKLHGHPYNSLATKLAKESLRLGDYIAGDVLVTPNALVD